MGWVRYYLLLQKYDGDISKASKEEMEVCKSGITNSEELDKFTAREVFENPDKYPGLTDDLTMFTII